MGFEYSCFISYSHNPGNLTERLITDLYNALKNEIAACMRDTKIFIDCDRIKGGEFYDPKLSMALCKSVCMIMVYTPTYFDKVHTYCAKEFKAMEKIEKRRLELLGKHQEDSTGLIIPLIVRGERYFPEFIRENRRYYNFNDYIMPRCKSDNVFCTRRGYAKKIQEIAEYVFENYQNLGPKWNTSKECRNFQLPSDKEVSSWLDSLTINCPETTLPNRRSKS